MKKLLDYLNSLPLEERGAFAMRCKTTMGYLRKAISTRQKINAETCIHIERESEGVVLCEHIRPDVGWWVLRGRKLPEYVCPAVREPDAAPALTLQAPAAINSEATGVTHA